MARTKSVDPLLVEAISENLFTVLPILRKRVYAMDVVRGELGMPLSHIHVLFMLNEREEGSMSVTEISQAICMAKPNVTPLVDSLIEKKYVDRVRDAVDRRVVNIVILEGGRKKVEEIVASVCQEVQRWGQTLCAADFRELHGSLESLARILPIVQPGGNQVLK